MANHTVSIENLEPPKLLLRVHYSRFSLWFGFAIMFALTLFCIYAMIYVMEPRNFAIHPADFLTRRRARTALWIFRAMPEPIRILIVLMFTTLFATCTAAIMRLLWRNPPFAEFRSDGIVSHHLFKRRFDLWHKIRLIDYRPSYDKHGQVSHGFRITLPKYGFQWWGSHMIDLEAYKTKFDAQQVFNVLRGKRPDLLPDLFLAKDKPPVPPERPRKIEKPVAPAVEVKAGSWTG